MAKSKQVQSVDAKQIRHAEKIVKLLQPFALPRDQKRLNAGDYVVLKLGKGRGSLCRAERVVRRAIGRKLYTDLKKASKLAPGVEAVLGLDVAKSAGLDVRAIRADFRKHREAVENAE